MLKICRFCKRSFEAERQKRQFCSKTCTGASRVQQQFRPERFLACVELTPFCWIWKGSRNSDGYGSYRAGMEIKAHRVAYQLFVGPIPKGLELDHVCGNRACVNPKHLDPVTHRENVLRGNAWAARQARQTCCTQGHPFEGSNLIIGHKGRRICRICRDRRNREYKRAEKPAKEMSKLL